MKLLHTFVPFDAITASDEDAEFPVTNVKDADPGTYWKPEAYTTDVTITIDFGAAVAAAVAFLNRANFPSVKIQGNATDSWGTPSYDQTFALAIDDASNRKGWLALTAFNYRWMRIVIPSGQTLDDTTGAGTTDALPILGNVIVGASTGVATLPLVSAFSQRLLGRVDRFESDSGALVKRFPGRRRHVIALDVGDTLANIKAMPKTWTLGVVFADLDSVSDAWLVYPPDEWTRPVRNTIDAGLSITLEEKP